jgi:hypothetical protein
MAQAPVAAAGPWGAAMTLSVESQTPFHAVLGPSIRNPRGLQQVLRCMQAVVAAELAREGTKTKQGAQTIAKTLTEMMKAVVHYVAKTPSIAGDTSGVSLENAKMYATKVRDSLVEISGGPRALTAHYLSTRIGWKTLSLATTSFVDIISGLAEIANERGQITSEAIATALPVKAQYYPAAVAAIVGEIQARYDQLPLTTNASRILGPILAGGDLSQAMMMNGPCGHFQCAIPILQAAVMQLDHQMYRRDPREVFDGAGNRVALDAQVLPFATYAMRAGLTSALEMSIELGDVNRITKSGAIGTAGPKTTFKVKYNTPFARLMELAIHTKRYYNPAGPKDLAQYINDTKGAASIHDNTIAWKSLKRNDDGYDFGTASLVLEVETRLRISEYNNDAAVVPAGSQQGPPKPSSKDAKVPNFTYFMKAPRELIEAVPIASTAASFDQFKAQAGLRQDTARRLKAMFDARGGDNRAFIADLTRLAQEIGKVCELIALMHHARAIGESSRVAACAKAKHTKLPRS